MITTIWVLSVAIVLLLIVLIKMRKRVWGPWVPGTPVNVYDEFGGRYPIKTYLPIFRTCRATGKVQRRKIKNMDVKTWNRMYDRIT